MCSFSVAVNRRKVNEDGSHDVDYFRVSAWSKLGEMCAKWLVKGRKVCVVGPVTVSIRTGNDGKTYTNLEVTAEDVEFLSQRENDNQAAAQPSNVPQGFAQVESDELPF